MHLPKQHPLSVYLRFPLGRRFSVVTTLTTMIYSPADRFRLRLSSKKHHLRHPRTFVLIPKRHILKSNQSHTFLSASSPPKEERGRGQEEEKKKKQKLRQTNPLPRCLSRSDEVILKTGPEGRCGGGR
jgi:hypothetical protein